MDKEFTENPVIAYEKLKQENEELKKQHYEVLKMLKHEYDGRQRDNEQWFTRCTENHNEDSKIIDKYYKALEEIREIAGWHTTNKDSCDVQGDMESIIDIIDEVLKDNLDEAINVFKPL